MGADGLLVPSSPRSSAANLTTDTAGTDVDSEGKSSVCFSSLLPHVSVSLLKLCMFPCLNNQRVRGFAGFLFSLYSEMNNYKRLVPKRDSGLFCTHSICTHRFADATPDSDNHYFLLT